MLDELESQRNAFRQITRWLSISAVPAAAAYAIAFLASGDRRILPVLAVHAVFAAATILVGKYVRRTHVGVFIVCGLLAVGVLGVVASVSGIGWLIAVTALIMPILLGGVAIGTQHMLPIIIVSGVAAVAVELMDEFASWPRFDLSTLPLVVWLVRIAFSVILILLFALSIRKLDRSSREARESARQLRLLYETSRLFGATKILDDLLPIVADNLAHILDATSSTILLCDPLSGEPLPATSYSTHQQETRSMRFQADEPSVTRAVFHSRQPLVIDDARQSPLVSPRIVEKFAIRSLVALPLIHREECLGTVILTESRRLRRFTPDEIGRVQGLVQQVAAEIANAQSLERERHQSAELRILHQVSAATAASLDPAEVCRFVVQEVSQAASYEHVSLYFLDGSMLRLQAITGHSPIIREISASRGIMGRVVRTGQPILLADVNSDPDYVTALSEIASEACAPIRFGDKTLGVLNVETCAPRILGSDDLKLLVAIAGQVALTLRNTQLFAQSQRRSREMEALHEIEQAITALDLDRCLRTVAVSARSLMNASLSHVFLVEPGGLRLQAASGPFEHRVGDWFLTEGRGLVGWAAAQRQAVNVPDVNADPRYHHTVGATQSEIAIPLLVDGEVIGVLDVQSDQLAAFDTHDTALLGMLADEAAIAIRNARLFDSERRSRQVTETLLDATRALGSTLDLGRLLDLIVDQLRVLTACDSASIALLDAENRHYTLRASIGLPDSFGQNEIIFDVESTPTAQRLIELRRPLRITDTQTSADWIRVEGFEHIRAWLGLPLIRNEQIIGFAFLDHHQPGFFTEEHERLAEAISAHAAIAIENARLLEHAHRQAEHERLMRNINSKISASIDLDSVMQTAVEELGRALGASHCLLRLGADPNNMPVSYEFHQPGFSPINLGERDHQPMLDRAVSERHTVIDLEARLFNGLPMLSGLITPIFIRNRVTGVLTLHQCDRPRRWAAEEIALIESVSAQLSIAMDNARLYQEANQTLADLGLLHNIAMAVASAASLPEAVNSVVESVHAGMRHPRVTLLLTDPSTSDLVVGASVGYDSDLSHVRIKAGQGITGWVAQTGQPALVPDVHADPRFFDASGDPSIRSELAVPLIAGSDVAGVLNLESTQHDAFTEADLHLLTTLGGNLAMIINNLRLLDEVRAANVRLQELDRLKSQFLANVSHELRTPLNSIIGFSEVLLDNVVGALGDEQHEFVTNIHTSGKHLLELINDVLDLSKMQAGKMKLICQPVTPHAIFDEVSAVIAPLIAHKRQQLALQSDSDLPDVSADAFRLKQILINLLSNAHKFSPEDSRIILAARRDDGFVCFSVIDQGSGIRPEDHERVFQEFVQISDGLTRAQDGTGLGLPITRRLVELHGGRIWIESVGAPGQGAAFHFTIPLTETPDALALPDPMADTCPTAGGSTGHRRRVLIIEDDRQFGNLLALYLSQQGYQPMHRYDGQAILATVRELRPALITLDLMLPGRDGWSVLHDLKSELDTRDIPVIIISALDAAEVGLSEGAMEYLTKPLDADALLGALQRIDPAPHPSPHQVLIVDDDPLISELLKAMLPSSEYTVAMATNGLDALDAIRRAQPDVILLDLLMPGMNGHELLELLRADPATHNLPVIILTAKLLSDAEQAHFDAAAQTVIRKTDLTRQHLIDALRRLRLPARLESEMQEAPHD